MKKNVSHKDRKIRITVGVFLIVLGAAGYAGLVPLANVLPQALTSVLLTFIGLALIVTGYTRKCVIYRILGKSSNN
ncbi:MAG: hypothetical protein ACI977_000456 [Candidatus Nanohaloarchaea archaeon]|jgi:hypothetical protein